MVNLLPQAKPEAQKLLVENFELFEHFSLLQVNEKKNLQLKSNVSRFARKSSLIKTTLVSHLTRGRRSKNNKASRFAPGGRLVKTSMGFSLRSRKKFSKNSYASRFVRGCRFTKSPSASRFARSSRCNWRFYAYCFAFDT